MMTSVKNAVPYSFPFFLALSKVFKIPSMCAKFKPEFKSVNSSFLSRKGFLFHQGLLGQNTPVGIGLIELTKQSDKLNYKPFLKHCILETILHAFLSFLFVWSKIFCSKNSALFCGAKSFVLKTEPYSFFSFFFFF